MLIGHTGPKHSDTDRPEVVICGVPAARVTLGPETVLRYESSAESSKQLQEYVKALVLDPDALTCDRRRIEFLKKPLHKMEFWEKSFKFMMVYTMLDRCFLF